MTHHNLRDKFFAQKGSSPFGSFSSSSLCLGSSSQSKWWCSVIWSTSGLVSANFHLTSTSFHVLRFTPSPFLSLTWASTQAARQLRHCLLSEACPNTTSQNERIPSSYSEHASIKVLVTSASDGLLLSVSHLSIRTLRVEAFILCNFGCPGLSTIT